MHRIHKFEKEIRFPSGFPSFPSLLPSILGLFPSRFQKLKKCCPLLTTLVSGSPIIQNGKLVGAVTHVLVNDPTKGYAIFIENMLKSAE